eukprot:1065449_1
MSHSQSKYFNSGATLNTKTLTTLKYHFTQKRRMQAVGWSDKTSKKARKKKVAALTKALNPESEKKRKKASKRKNGANQNLYHHHDHQYEEYPQYELSNKQYRLSQKIAQFWPNYRCEHVLPKIITQLKLQSFDPNDEKQKIEILNCLLQELQDAVTGKSRHNKKKKRLQRQRKEREIEQRERERNESQKKKKKQQNIESKKSGKFRQFMVAVGNVLLDYLDRDTLSTLIRIESFSFLHQSQLQILSTKQRLMAYISHHDIAFRIQSFNAKLNTLSALKLYKFRSQWNTPHCIKLILLNMLNVDDRFSACAYNTNMHMIQIDIRKNNSVSNMPLVAKIIKTKCKIFNIWKVMRITDVNQGYALEFAEYQDGNTSDAHVVLNHLNQIVVNKSMLSQKNIKSMHCAYVKAIKNYELHSFLCLFVELKTEHFESMYEQNTKQFMVWSGQCGIKPN